MKNLRKYSIPFYTDGKEMLSLKDSVRICNFIMQQTLLKTLIHKDTFHYKLSIEKRKFSGRSGHVSVEHR
jgi:hypothetical protein